MKQGNKTQINAKTYTERWEEFSITMRNRRLSESNWAEILGYAYKPVKQP